MKRQEPGGLALGIIGGSSFLKSQYFATFEPLEVSTAHGKVRLCCNTQRSVFFVQRHKANPSVEYTLPHEINAKAIVTALKELGCGRVLGFGSVGSLHKSLPLSTLVVPDDYLNPHNITHFHSDASAHIVPGFNSELRAKVLNALSSNGVQARGKGVYVQTHGPRFETAAEIRQVAGFADVVGMTCAHEATLCKELALPYALVCVVDNMANGVLSEELSTEQFHKGVKNNLTKMNSVLGLLLAALGPAAASSSASSSAAAEEEEMKDPRQHVDLLVTARYVVPVRPSPLTVLEHHAVAVREGKIVALLPTEEALKLYKPTKLVERGEHHVLMPGFVNAHSHVGMTFLRGYSDDESLLNWLTKHIWPAEGTFLDSEWVQAGTELAAAEMIRGGTTTFNDMYFFPGDVAAVADRAGLRAVIGMIIIGFPSKYAGSHSEYLAKGNAVRAQYHAHPRLSFSYAPHAPYTVQDTHLKELYAAAKEAKAPFHIHMHETAEECSASLALDKQSTSCHQSDQKCRPLANMNRMGCIGPNLVAVHMTQLTQEERGWIKKGQAHIVHCPTSNLKLASGTCPVRDLLDDGVNVAIGTDSAASNNRLDMFMEMRMASLVAKGSTQDPQAVPCHVALEMATINGAKALGLEAKTGSLEVGKAADFMAVSFDSIETQPMFNVLSHLVYVAPREHVTDVWVDGRQLLDARRLTTLDEHAIQKKAAAFSRTGLDFKAQAAAAAEKKA